MTAQAPRQPLLGLQRLVRGAALASALVAGWTSAAQACSLSPLAKADVVSSSVVSRGEATAWFAGLSDRYAHGVLGDALEPTKLHLLTAQTSAQCGLTASLSEPYVFEDIAPRLVDLDQDGDFEVIVVRSHANKGAQLAVYGQRGTRLELVAATPHIGQRNRWLAPIGTADFDGDGHVEIGFIDRPHLAKTLRLWRFKNGKLREVAALEGLTNHKIGWDFIASGVRDCGNGPEMITADAGWKHIMATRFDGKTIAARRVGPYSGTASLERALSCAK